MYIPSLATTPSSFKSPATIDFGIDPAPVEYPLSTSRNNLVSTRLKKEMELLSLNNHSTVRQNEAKANDRK